MVSVSFSQAYDHTSDIIEYTYSESFHTSQTEDIFFNYTLQSIYHNLFINISFSNANGVFDYNTFNAVSFLFVSNNTEIQLSMTYVSVNDVHFNYYYLYFTPEVTNKDISIIFHNLP